ncbi:MAG: ComF family protein [Acetatifactor sp.]
MVYPLHCPVCDDIVTESEERICTGCLGGLKLLLPPWCMKCGKKVEEGEEYCVDCSRKDHLYDRGRALYEYGSAAESIYRFKYGGRREYAEFYGSEMAEFLGDFIRNVAPDALVPIPLHRNRKIQRGYNQAELLAKAMGRSLDVPVYPNLLERVKNTVPQKKLNPHERQNNLKKAFNITRNDVKLKVIMVIDDIYTTGATIDEAARALREAGAEKIYFITLACGAGI